MWPAAIVQQLFPILPEAYLAAPAVHLGAAFEINVSAYEQHEPKHHEKVEIGRVAVAAPTGNELRSDLPRAADCIAPRAVWAAVSRMRVTSEMPHSASY